MHDRKPDTVEFNVQQTTLHIVNVQQYDEATSSGLDNWLAQADAAVKCEPSSGPEIKAVFLYAEGELVSEYTTGDCVLDRDDRDAIVIAAVAAGINLSGDFAAPGKNHDHERHQRLTFDQ